MNELVEFFLARLLFGSVSSESEKEAKHRQTDSESHFGFDCSSFFMANTVHAFSKRPG